MFIMHLPSSFKIGETADVTINGRTQRLTWTDVHTLTIEPNDRRRILTKEDDGELITFVCSDSEKDTTVKRSGPFGAVISFDDPEPPKKRKTSP
jgi:hypothetical protein